MINPAITFEDASYHEDNAEVMELFSNVVDNRNGMTSGSDHRVKWWYSIRQPELNGGFRQSE